MQAEDLTGYYTYRSFLNNPGLVADFNELRFGEAELYLSVQQDRTITGTLSFPSASGVDRKDFMDITGEVLDWSTVRFRLSGKGRPRTGIADFHYEYDGVLSRTWETGVGQRLSLTGTVLRAKDHGSGTHVARAGATASFVAVKRDFPAPRVVPGVAMRPEALSMLATRVHRLRHTTWHLLRSVWRSPLSNTDRKEITELGWGIERPPFNDKGLNLTNGAGEDFLFMHRRMIQMVNDIYKSSGVPVIRGWRPIPGADAPQYVYTQKDDPARPGEQIMQYDAARSGFMVPPADAELLATFPETSRPTMKLLKSPAYLNFTMRALERTYTSPIELSRLSLGALGNLLEFTIHNPMHMRWASIPRDAQGKIALRGDFDFDEKWDDPAYDYLGDFYSSHLNPLFWRLHGWVDDRIEDWFEAHEAVAAGEIERTTHKGVSWFKAGKWVAVTEPFDWPESGHHHHDEHGHGDEHAIAVMLKVLKIVQRAQEPRVAEGPAAEPHERRMRQPPLNVMSFLRWIDASVE
ncbi:hypothetical protein SAMN05444920_109205 [Nonomuraea solani]|uniref:Uncharacterized protein n=1 Tax=Nonomuraea solani TaxID=1144553 RepID=A0A1H6EF89_9ACTN|nr:hypothetical protein [Nonomuraea solani]SEG95933.1 hypothetical protein SAMN05444920_109205 [Nonomuraea solani]